MATFVDRNNNTWSIAINLGSMKRVRQLTNIDIAKMIGNDQLGEIFQDLIALGDILFALVKPQADKEGITDEQFGELLASDTLEDATKALVQAIIDFSPSRHAIALREMLAKGMKEAESHTEKTLKDCAIGLEASQE